MRYEFLVNLKVVNGSFLVKRTIIKLNIRVCVKNSGFMEKVLRKST